MVKTKRILGLFLLLLPLLFSFSNVVDAKIEWRVIYEIDLEEQPLDMATTIDGKVLFILLPGEILVYSIAEAKVTDRIPFKGEFERLVHSAKDNRLILFSRSGKAVKVIEPEVTFNIDYSGLPFKGPSDAPVTIAVFTDYQ